MSLLSDAMDNWLVIDKVKAPDGYGGGIDTFKEGMEFKAAIVFDTSIEARVGEKHGVTSRYTVTTRRSMSLQYHDVFKRERDGKIFRVTSDGDDKYTPAGAGLDMRQVTAEEWVPTGTITPVETGGA